VSGRAGVEAREAGRTVCCFVWVDAAARAANAAPSATAAATVTCVTRRMRARAASRKRAARRGSLISDAM